MIEQKTPFAPGARIVVRDAEWLVRRVDPTLTGGKQFSGKQQSINFSGASCPTKSSSVHEFSTVEDARSYTKENPGSKMKRDASGKGWIVEVHEQQAANMWLKEDGEDYIFDLEAHSG